MRILITLLLMVSLNGWAGVSAWIPFDSSRGHIKIPITLNGIKATAILDTGASGNGISERFLAANVGHYGKGKSVVLRGVYGERRVNLVNNIQLGMFGSEFRLDQLMPMRAGGFDLLIGLPFFQNYIIQIDYPQSQLRLIDHDSLDLRDIANVRMTHERGSKHPLVQVNLNDEYKPWVLFDTGNSGGLLMPRSDVERRGWLERYGTQESRSVGVNAVVRKTERLNLPQMTIGPYTLENVIVTVPEAGINTNIAEGPSHGSRRDLHKKSSKGILGYDVLKHFIVTIDFRNKKLFVEIPAE